MPGVLDLRGPERIALIGRNGAGKTTLLRTVAGELAPVSGERPPMCRWASSPSAWTSSTTRLSLVDNVARFAPGATATGIRARLAHFLFKGGRADRPAGTLSGGERLRATLAALLLADPAPRLLMLDEPTNSLDLSGVHRLTSALAAYQGALIVASHDLPFLKSTRASPAGCCWTRRAPGHHSRAVAGNRGGEGARLVPSKTPMTCRDDSV